MATLRVLSYNVRSLRDDPVAVTRVIRASGAQLVCVQEAPAYWRWQSRCAEFARRCGMVAIAGGGGGAFGAFLMSSIAVDVVVARTFRLAHRPMRPEKGAAVATLAYRGSRFVAASTHLATHPDERREQMRSLLDALPADGPPLVVAGDFNEETGGPAWGLVAGRLTDAAGETATPTYSCRAPRRRIDGIFVSPQVSVLAYGVLDSPDARRASDHFPVYAELELPAPAR